MAERKQGLSITLPRNFAYHSPDGLPPKTPEQPFSELSLPAPPHNDPCKFRRPRLDAITASATHDGTLPTLLASDIPIPSIEVAPSSEMRRPYWSNYVSAQPFDDRSYLSPRRDFIPPRTPPAQMPTTPMGPELSSAWELKRPDSSCSVRSDSSISSDESFGTRPSFGGSCTSPESDFQDPFSSRASQYQDSPIKPKPSRKTFTNQSDSAFAAKTRWTPEMDTHLWNVYQMYLQDPTITPFKTVPGSLPPLGVCHRVAREARRSWPKATKASHGQRTTSVHSSRFARDITPDMQSQPHRSGSSTPTGMGQELERPKNAWPKESQTRRRLKELCKRKFSIAPHYQRLLQSRSPSPFLDSFVRRPASSRASTLPPRDDNSTSFTTRDLGVSLMSSGNGGPLAQLASETSSQQTSPEISFNTPIESERLPEMSSSPSSVGSSRMDDQEPPSSIPRLASPFAYNTWGPTRSSRRTQRPTLSTFDTIHATGSRLLSPVRLDPFTNAHKRRAQGQLDQELSPGGSDLRSDIQNLFSQQNAPDMSQRRVRLRNRGHTLGAVGNRERLDSLFTPPTDTMMSGGPSESLASLAPPAEETKRLGSPFELDGKRSLRSSAITASRSPRHASSTSEPHISNPFLHVAPVVAVPSIGERLASFEALQQQSQSSASVGNTDLMLDATAVGITDAERIRRQLLNRSQRR